MTISKYDISGDGHAAHVEFTVDDHRAFTGRMVSTEFSGSAEIKGTVRDDGHLVGKVIIGGTAYEFLAVTRGDEIAGTVGPWPFRESFSGTLVS